MKLPTPATKASRALLLRLIEEAIREGLEEAATQETADLGVSKARASHLLDATDLGLVLLQLVDDMDANEKTTYLMAMAFELGRALGPVRQSEPRHE